MAQQEPFSEFHQAVPQDDEMNVSGSEGNVLVQAGIKDLADLKGFIDSRISKMITPVLLLTLRQGGIDLSKPHLQTTGPNKSTKDDEQVRASQDVADQTETATSTVPDIWRTVIREAGGVFMRDKTFTSLTEAEYKSIKDGDLGNAFEMQKQVRVIPQPETRSRISPRGIPALDGAIVDQVISEKIIIRSPLLLKAIKETVYWPSTAYYGSGRLEINTPFRSIGVHREEFSALLEQFKEDLKTAEESKSIDQNTAKTKQELETSIKHLSLFLEQVDNVQSENVDLERARHQKGKTTFDMLWMILRPGTYVYVTVNGIEIAMRVKLLVWDHGPHNSAGIEDAYMCVTANMWYLDHDGSVINRRAHSVTINRYEGEKNITDLPVFPESFAHDRDRKRTERIDKGRVYLNLVRNQFALCEYNGMLSIHDRSPLEAENHRAFQGKVIIDPGLHHRENGANQGVTWMDDADTHSKSLGEEMKKFCKVDPHKDIKAFTDDHCFLLSHWLRGFTISTRGERKWVWLNVANIKTYVPDRALVDTVAISEDDLDVIKALTHRADPTSADNRIVESVFSPDHIKHKGEGRVIILHGVPGLGKTYTVECIAEWSNRPLLRLTCAELGLDPTSLEKTIESYLRRAERWRAIVLIDEADIFMGKRNESITHEKEALVAVFLRALEYYSGIIFLTTNRVDLFDRAILDRTILIVRYDPLSPAQRGKIRENCLRRLEEDNSLSLDFDARKEFEKVDNDKDYDWDGREIVQVIKLAGILAQYSYNSTENSYRSPTVKVKAKHIKQAMASICKHAIYKTSQRDSEQRQQEEKARKKEKGYIDDRLG